MAVCLYNVCKGVSFSNKEMSKQGSSTYSRPYKLGKEIIGLRFPAFNFSVYNIKF